MVATTKSTPTKSAPRYVVTQEPGAPIGQIFVKPGETFEAPAGYVPSVTMLPLNEEAVVELERAFAVAEDHLLERLAQLQGADRYRVKNELESLHTRRERAKAVVTPAELGALRSAIPGAR